MDSKQSGYEEDRLNILKMVEEGKISASEAASLLSAISREKNPSPDGIGADISEAPPAPEVVVEPIPPADIRVAGIGPRWFRVRVTDLTSGRTKVTVNLPIGLVNWGMKIGARYAPEVSELDFNELSQILASGAEGKLVDVVDEEDGEHVEIFFD